LVNLLLAPILVHGVIGVVVAVNVDKGDAVVSRPHEVQVVCILLPISKKTIYAAVTVFGE
jgi:hypothetical protein